MTGIENSPMEVNLLFEASEAVTKPISVAEIASYNPFDPAQVSVTAISLEVVSADQIATDLCTGLQGIAAQDTLDKLILNAHVNELIQARRDSATNAFLLYWEGSCRVPSGVSVGEKVITNTKWGLVQDKAGKFIGTYQRLLDHENVTKDTQGIVNAMLIFI